jgi:hypothetical protein
MSTAPLTSGVARVISEMVKGKTEFDVALAKQVAGAIAKSFKVTPEEVAILKMAPGGKMLEFVVPEKLAKVGSVPVSSTSSLAARTASSGKGEAINNFSGAKHATVFEAIKVTKEAPDPIQKIVSVPVLVSGKAQGVIQVSRKGKSPGAAGPDFSPKDVEELSQIATAISPCFQTKQG